MRVLASLAVYSFRAAAFNSSALNWPSPLPSIALTSLDNRSDSDPLAPLAAVAEVAVVAAVAEVAEVAVVAVDCAVVAVDCAVDCAVDPSESPSRSEMAASVVPDGALPERA